MLTNLSCSFSSNSPPPAMISTPSNRSSSLSSSTFNPTNLPSSSSPAANLSQFSASQCSSFPPKLPTASLSSTPSTNLLFNRSSLLEPSSIPPEAVPSIVALRPYDIDLVIRWLHLDRQIALHQQNLSYPVDSSNSILTQNSPTSSTLLNNLPLYPLSTDQLSQSSLLLLPTQDSPSQLEPDFSRWGSPSTSPTSLVHILPNSTTTTLPNNLNDSGCQKKFLTGPSGKYPITLESNNFPHSRKVLVTNHKSALRTSRSEHERKQRYVCTSCEVKFTRRWDWKHHEETVHERWRKFPCPDCNQEFWSENSFNQHHRSAHNCKNCPHAYTVKQNLEKRVAWGCGFCTAVLYTWEERCKHVASHFDNGETKNDWKHSNVIYGLLHQPDLIEAWKALLEFKHGSDPNNIPCFNWNIKTTGRQQGSCTREAGGNASIMSGQLQDKLEFARGPDASAVASIIQEAYDLGITDAETCKSANHEVKRRNSIYPLYIADTFRESTTPTTNEQTGSSGKSSTTSCPLSPDVLAKANINVNGASIALNMEGKSNNNLGRSVLGEGNLRCSGMTRSQSLCNPDTSFRGDATNETGNGACRTAGKSYWNQGKRRSFHSANGGINEEKISLNEEKSYKQAKIKHLHDNDTICEENLQERKVSSSSSSSSSSIASSTSSASKPCNIMLPFDVLTTAFGTEEYEHYDVGWNTSGGEATGNEFNVANGSFSSCSSSGSSSASSSATSSSSLSSSTTSLSSSSSSSSSCSTIESIKSNSSLLPFSNDKRTEISDNGAPRIIMTSGKDILTIDCGQSFGAVESSFSLDDINMCNFPGKLGNVNSTNSTKENIEFPREKVFPTFEAQKTPDRINPSDTRGSASGGVDDKSWQMAMFGSGLASSSTFTASTPDCGMSSPPCTGGSSSAKSSSLSVSDVNSPTNGGPLTVCKNDLTSGSSIMWSPLFPSLRGSFQENGSGNPLSVEAELASVKNYHQFTNFVAPFQ